MDKETIRKLVNDGALGNHLVYLSLRWKDEKDYEDFADYTKSMADAVTKVIGEITKPEGTKRPFGLKFTKDNERFHLCLKTDKITAWLALKRL